MGKLSHVDVGAELTKVEWEAEVTHLIGGIANLNIVRAASVVIAASDSIASDKAQADIVCTGVADEVDFQAAHDALTNGGTIIALPGTYTFAADMNLSSDHIKVMGYGAVIEPSALLDYAFHITGTFITIEGFAIDGTVGAFCFYFPIYAVAPATNVEIAHNHIIEVQQKPASTWGMCIYIDNGVSYVDIHLNYIADNGANVYGIMVGHNTGGGAAVTHVNVCNNIIINSTYNGIGIYNDTSEFLVDGNIVTTTGHNCIAASAAHNGVISNNRVSGAQDASESGIEVETNVAHGNFNTYAITVTGNIIIDGNPGIEVNAADAKTIRDIVISNNILRQGATGFGGEIFVSSAAGSVQRLTIIGNSLYDSSSHGITINSIASHIQIIGNYIIDALNSGIIANSPDYLVISDNIIDGSNTGLATNHAVRILGTATYVIVTGNQLLNTGGNAAGEGYAFKLTAATDEFIVFKNNICKGNYSFGALIESDSVSFDLMPVSVEMDLSAAAEDFPVFLATMPCQIAGYTVAWTEAAGDANTCDIRVGEVTSGGVADDDEYDAYTTAGNEALGRNDVLHTSDMTDTIIAAGTHVTVGHTQKVGNGKVIITLWIVQQVSV